MTSRIQLFAACLDNFQDPFCTVIFVLYNCNFVGCNLDRSTSDNFGNLFIGPTTLVQMLLYILEESQKRCTPKNVDLQ